MDMQILIILFFSFITGIGIGWFFASKKTDISFIKNEFEQKNNIMSEQTVKINELADKNHRLEKDIQDINHKKEELERYKQDISAVIENLQKQNKLEFENVINKIVADSQNKIKSTNEESLNNILKPVQNNFDEFKKQVNNFILQDKGREEALKEKIEHLIGKTNEVSGSAFELAKAIKGESIVRGSWGEETLIEILKQSGLVTGYNLFIQTQTKDNKRTDIMIKLPNGHKIIIDAKTIFVDYEKYVNSKDPKEKKEALKSHIKQIESIADSLSMKKYPDQLQQDSEMIEPDFTLMFVNPESALSAACQEKPELTVKSWEKKVALVSATSIINTINMIAKLWEVKLQTDEMQSIKENAEKLVAKFNNFLINFAEAHKKVKEAGDSLDVARGHIDGNSGAILPVAQKIAEIYPNQITQKQDRNLLKSQGYKYDGSKK